MNTIIWEERRVEVSDSGLLWHHSLEVRQPEGSFGYDHGFRCETVEIHGLPEVARVRMDVGGEPLFAAYTQDRHQHVPLVLFPMVAEPFYWSCFYVYTEIIRLPAGAWDAIFAFKGTAEKKPSKPLNRCTGRSSY